MTPSPSDSCAAILGEAYAALPDTDEGHDQALVMRLEYALHLCSLWQLSVLFDQEFSGLSEPELNTLLGDRADFPEVDSWDHDYPLILLATHFAPYTGAAAPSGNIILVDPTTEDTFVQAVNDAKLPHTVQV